MPSSAASAGLRSVRDDTESVATVALEFLPSVQLTTPVEFYGQMGLGKTTLLRHLAHHPVAAVFPDGVIFLSARHQSVEDLLQCLFDAFYESDVPFKPSDAQVRHALQDKQALIILDDVDLAWYEVEVLMDAAPACAFLLASLERCLWREGQAVELRGLPADDALALVERELGHSLSPEERPSAQALCTAVDGHPLHILQAVAVVREGGCSLAEMVQRVQTPSPAEALSAQVLDRLSEPERRVVAALAVLGDAPVQADLLHALTDLPDVMPVVQALEARGLVQAHSPCYSLPGTLGETVRQTWDLTLWAERVLAHLITWTEQRGRAPDQLMEEADAILHVLEWAVGAGRWTEVLRLGRAVEGGLALGRRWSAWGQVLRWLLQAAQALENSAAEAWALHQLGTKALCIEDTATACASLTEALCLRESMGDQTGAAATRHNLSILPGGPPVPGHEPPVPSARPPLAKWFIPVAGIVVVMVSLLVGVAIGRNMPSSTRQTPVVTYTITSTSTLAPTPELGTGDVQITLRWDTDSDIDLIVIDPNGERIYFDHPISQSGGQMDRDANAYCMSGEMMANPVENVFWPQGEAATGRYHVFVQYSLDCSGIGRTNWWVRVLVDGVVNEFSGTLHASGDKEMVTDFSR